MAKKQIVENIDSLPINSLSLDNDKGSVLASMSSDLVEAKGEYVLVKKAIKEYVDRNISSNRELLNNYTYSLSDIIKSAPELQDEYEISYKPNFMRKEGNNVVINLSNYGLTVYNQKKTKTIFRQNIIITQNEIASVLNPLPIDYEGCIINDSNCDGTENSKFLSSIKVTNIPLIIENTAGIYKYFLTSNNEILYGVLDIESEKIVDIVRGNCVSENYEVLPLKVINDQTRLYLLNSIRVYYDLDTERVVLIPTEKVLYCPKLQSTGGNVNDCFYSTTEEVWKIFNHGVWETHNSYVYLGDLIYKNSNLIGVYNSDLKCVLDNVNNVDIRVSNNIAYSYSDYLILSVFDKMVEFSVDRLRWDISNYNEVYLYVDGDGKTWTDTLKPRYNSLLEYHVHYYHYWRCVGHLKYENNNWAIKEI